MDLAWCIICDNRVDDGQQLDDTSLYCSESCKIKDLTTPQQQQQLASPPRSLTPSLSTGKSAIGYRASNNASRIPLLRNRRAAAAAAVTSNAYPWVPLYRRRRGVVISAPRRCQPIVASSYTNANGLLSHGSFLTSTAVTALMAAPNMPTPTTTFV